MCFVKRCACVRDPAGPVPGWADENGRRIGALVGVIGVGSRLEYIRKARARRKLRRQFRNAFGELWLKRSIGIKCECLASRCMRAWPCMDARRC